MSEEKADAEPVSEELGNEENAADPNDDTVITADRGATFHLLAVFIAALFVLALLGVRYRPLTPQNADAAGGEFSAGRALETLDRLIGDGEPHPVGSAAQQRVAERLEGELRDLRLDSSLQETFYCNPRGECAMLRNVLARIDGESDDFAVLIVVHYDSVPASVGAADNGMSVAAALEVARLMQTGEKPRNPLIFLFSDGEEAGLLGARAFWEEHPWAKEVGAVVNLDGRGNSGPSLLFELGPGNRDLMALYADEAPRPITNSLMASIYEVMPNDTDFSVFREAGLRGLNFAFIGDVAAYHARIDDPKNLDRGTVEHHGENLYAAVRALGDVDPATLGSGDAVFFDLFGSMIVRWPTSLNLPLAALAIALLIFVLGSLLRRGATGARQLLWGVFGWTFLLLLPLIFAALTSFALVAAGGIPKASLWLAQPWPITIAFWILGPLVVFGLAHRLGRRSGFWGLWAGGWIWTALLAALLAGSLPGAVYPFLLPALTAGVLGLGAARGKLHEEWAVSGPAIISILTFFPTLVFLYQGLGTPGLPILAAATALAFAVPLAPLVFRLGRPACKLPMRIAIGLTFLLLVVSTALPKYTAEAPQPLNLLFYQNLDAGEAHYYLQTGGSVSDELLQSAEFGDPVPPFPWSGGRVRFHAAPAPLLDAPPPEFEILADEQVDGTRRLRALLRSPRGAEEMRLMIRKTVPIREISIGGAALPEPLEEPPRIRRKWRHYICYGVPAEGLEIEMTVDSTDPFELILRDESMGLPPSGQAISDARSATENPTDDGDTTMISRQLTI